MTIGLLLVMSGALLIWAGLTDNSILGLLGGIFGKQSSNTTPPAAGGGGGGGKKH